MNNALHARRIILGLTQREVAERAEITLQQYQRFESGSRNIMTCSFRIACRVIEALEMDIADFYHNGYAPGEEECSMVGRRILGMQTDEPALCISPVTRFSSEEWGFPHSADGNRFTGEMHSLSAFRFYSFVSPVTTLLRFRVCYDHVSLSFWVKWLHFLLLPFS